MHSHLAFDGPDGLVHLDIQRNRRYLFAPSACNVNYDTPPRLLGSCSGRKFEVMSVVRR
jgi:hypothetical protein